MSVGKLQTGFHVVRALIRKVLTFGDRSEFLCVVPSLKIFKSVQLIKCILDNLEKINMSENECVLNKNVKTELI